MGVGSWVGSWELGMSVFRMGVGSVWGVVGVRESWEWGWVEWELWESCC